MQTIKVVSFLKRREKKGGIIIFLIGFPHQGRIWVAKLCKTVIVNSPHLL